MNLQGAVTVVTGGAGGIGRALAERFAAEGVRAVVVADLDGREAARVAAGLACPSSLGAGLDVTDQAAVAGLVDRVEEQLGPVDLWCSNAGVALGRDLGSDGDGSGPSPSTCSPTCTWPGCWRRGWRPGAAGTCC
jgi:NAD(P)-dependent dehydrogenase (short-subunit alcohol dehydrogenase family)